MSFGSSAPYRRLSISMSTPAVSARRAASAPSAAIPCGISWDTASQSLTTKPENPHSPRRTWVSVKGLADDGTPLRSLNALMKVSAPASTAALKGGK